MTPPGPPRNGTSPSPSTRTASRRTERVVPLWEAADAHRLGGTPRDAGEAR